MWEKDIDINEIKEIRLKTTCYLGVGAIAKIDDIAKELKHKGIDSVLILTGRNSYKSTGAWAYVEKALCENNIKFALYDRVTPNPEVQHVDEAVAMGKEINAKAVIGIGGGSPIDTAKSASILLEYTDKNCQQLYEFEFTPEKAVPVIAINLTHGTGTEVNRFAVVSIPSKNYKPAIAYDCIYPMYAIDDPALMTSLPENQTKYVSIDAINHVVEACTSAVANPVSILFAKETVRLVAEYLPKAVANPKDLEARYYLTYAAMIAGSSFDNGLLHFTHALEHPLSGLKSEITHGLGLAILLPSVIKQIFKAKANTLAEVLAPLVPKLKGCACDVDYAEQGVRQWLHSVGVTETLKDLGFIDSDVEKLVDLAFTTPSLEGLLQIAPVDGNREVVKTIYIESL